MDTEVDVGSIDYLNSLKDSEYLLELGLNPNVIIKSIFIQTMNGKNDAYLYELDLYLKFLIDKAMQFGADVNSIFCEVVQNITFKIKEDLSLIIPPKIIEYLFTRYNLDINLILEAGILWNDELLVSYALNNGANSSAKNKISNNSFFFNSLFGNSSIRNSVFPVLEEIDIKTYIEVVQRVSFNRAIDFIKDFKTSFSQDKAYKFLRSIGKSEIETLGFLDIHSLMVDYLNKEGLSNYEIAILSAKYKIYLVPELRNKYGFSHIHLALIAKDYNLVKFFLKKNMDLYLQSDNKLTVIEMIVTIAEQNVRSELISLIAKDINNVDIEVGSGESLADRLLNNRAIENQVIKITKDKLFFFLKEDIDFESINFSSNYTNIAIAHGNEFWSTGIFSFARIARKQYPIEFYLINHEFLKKKGVEFLKNFDAIINPGAYDSFPKNLDEFSLNDIVLNLGVEKHYQQMLDISYKFNIPYIGFCAGAQHLILYHQGYLQKIENYNQGKKHISILNNTLAHFMNLNKIKQSEMLKNCSLKDVNFLGEVAHHYAAENSKLGENIELGGVSADNVAMIYNHQNGIRWGVQYHPENYYSLQDDNTNKQKPLLDNFLELALMHHDFRVHDLMHPIEFLAQIREEIALCF